MSNTRMAVGLTVTLLCLCGCGGPEEETLLRSAELENRAAARIAG